MPELTIAPLTLADRPVILHRLARHPPSVSELTFTNLYAWSGARPVWFSIADEALVFLVRPRADTDHFCLFGPPVGPCPEARRLAEAAPGLEGWFRIDAPTAGRLRAEGQDVVADPDNADYVYAVNELAELTGSRFHAQRNLVRQCLDAHDCVYEPIDSVARLDACLEVQTRWCAAHDCNQDAGLCHENQAVRETLRHFFEFELLGGLIRVDGVVQAFAVAEALAPGVAVWHFEKALPEIRGLGQLLTHWFARHALGGFTFVNREQDLGLPGLRQAKQRWNPHHQVPKFSACYGEGPVLGQLARCRVVGQ
jgi:uncharacterized protein